MKKILFALLLMLNHSLMFGAVQAATFPDEEHPFGPAIPHDHLHHHDHHEMDEHDPGHEEPHHQTDSATSDDEHHDHHHSHGMHVQLNCDLPCSLDLKLQKRCCDAPTYYHVKHQSLTYSPPVPPPNR